MAPARRRVWQNTGDEGMIGQHADRHAQREAHEYHAGSDSDAEGGDLVFNFVASTDNGDADLESDTAVRVGRSRYLSFGSFAGDIVGLLHVFYTHD